MKKRYGLCVDSLFFEDTNEAVACSRAEEIAEEEQIIENTYTDT